MRRLLKILCLILCGFFLNCGTHPTRNPNDDDSASGLSVSGVNDSLGAETPKPQPQAKPKKKFEVPNLQSLKDFVSYYRKTLEALGQTKEDSSYVVEREEVDIMKQQLARILQLEVSGVTFLVNPRTQGAWFGNCTLIIDKKRENFIIISKEGEEQTLSLKDKIFGGLYKSEKGDWIFVSAFYGDLQKKVPYRLFWGATELKVITFNIDRTKEATVEGRVKIPSGSLLSVSRKGRDNKTVQLGGQTLIPVFD